MPTTMPSYAFTDINVPSALGIAYARTHGGLIVTSRNADPYWHGTMTTQPLGVFGENNQHADFLAWMIWATDNNMRVDFVHPRHRLPRSYSADNWPMIGNASLISTPDQRTLRVSGVTEGIELRRGDRIAVYQSDLVVHRWVAADLIVTSEVAQNIPVTPRLPLGVLAPASTVALADPKMRFMIVPGSWDAAEVANPSQISFEVMEAVQ
jgi:hypothetical protein